MYTYVIDAPVGLLTICSDGAAITALRFGGKAKMGEETVHPLLEKCAGQLREYFAGKRKVFDVPLAPQGTAFQRLVWGELLQIPYGTVRTYGEVAAAIGRPTAARAVGMANHVNPLPIIIPCHRVVGRGGKLVGYAGGLSIKEFLLDLERENQG